MISDLDGFLERRSSLTKRQIECLNLQILARNAVKEGRKKKRFQEASSVSEGSYYRVLGQAKDNINQALYTVLLCSRMGIIQSGDFNRLLNLMSRAPAVVAGGSDDVIPLIDALVRKIVML